MKFEKGRISNEALMDIVSKIEKECVDIGIKNGKLMVHRSVSPSMLALIKRHKEELIEYLVFSEKVPEPYISTAGDLVIPFDSQPKYHWWRGGQSVAETVMELKAPEEIVRKYSSQKSGAAGGE